MSRILHHSAGRRPNFLNCTTATGGVTQLWCCVSKNIVNCLITQLSTHLHPAFTKFCCRLHYESHTSWSLHQHNAGRRPNFWNGTAASFMLDIIQSNIVNCLITQLSMHLHPAFTKFCCRPHYESHTSWSLHPGRRPNFWNGTTATGDVTQFWCCISINMVNCLITQLWTHLHPAFMKFCCRLHYESHTSWSLHHSAGRRPNFWNCTAAAFMLE
jgi:hypothetical protein